jgi:hypothetical protein
MRSFLRVLKTPTCPADSLVLDGTACLDGDVCNGDEQCPAGSCVAGLAALLTAVAASTLVPRRQSFT